MGGGGWSLHQTPKSFSKFLKLFVVMLNFVMFSKSSNSCLFPCPSRGCRCCDSFFQGYHHIIPSLAALVDKEIRVGVSGMSDIWGRGSSPFTFASGTGEFTDFHLHEK